MTKTFDEIFSQEDQLRLLKGLFEQESTSDFRRINSGGYTGGYQFSVGAAEDVGLIKKGTTARTKGNSGFDDVNNWTIQGGKESFLSDGELQSKAALEYMRINYKRLSKSGIIKADSTPEQIAGKLFQAHLGGSGNVDTEFADGNNVKVKKYDTLGRAVYAGQGFKIAKADIVSEHWRDAFYDNTLPTKIEAKPEEVSWGEILDVNARRDRVDISLMNNMAKNYVLSDYQYETPDYNPLDNLDFKYASFAGEISNAKNQEQRNIILSNIDREMADTEVAYRAGIVKDMVTSIGVGATDPIMALPLFGPVFKGGQILGKIAMTAARTAGIVGTQEVALQGLQSARPIEESVTNVIGGAVLGGVFAGLSKSKIPYTTEMVKAAEGELNTVTKDPLGDSVGAARVVEESSQLYVPNAATKAATTNWFSDSINLNSPIVRAATSEVESIAAAADKLVGSNVILQKHAAGQASEMSIENSMKVAVRKFSNVFVNLANESMITTKIDATEFAERVGKAIHTKTADIDPVINKMVKYVEGIFSKDLRRLNSIDRFGGDIEGPKYAKNYFPRVFNKDATTINVVAFRDLIKKYVRAAVKKELGYKIDEVETPQMKAEIDQYAEVDANALVAKVRNEGDSFTMRYTSTRSMKERTLAIPDEELAPFLENDIRKVLPAYIKGVELEVGLHEKFGTWDKQIIMGNLKNDIITKEVSIGDPIERNKFSSKAFAGLEAVGLMINRLDGSHFIKTDGVDQLTRAVLIWNSVRLLGGTALTALTEVPKLAFNGIFKPTGKDIAEVGNIIKGLKLTPAQAKAYGIGGEIELLKLKMYMSDSANPYASEMLATSLAPRTALLRKMDGMLDSITHKFAYYSFMTKTDDILRYQALKENADNTIKSMQRLMKGTLSKKDSIRLARLGFDKTNSPRILEEFEKHSFVRDGIRQINLEDWGSAGDEFMSKISVDVDNIITRAGAGDKFAITDQSFWGRILFQFRTFSQGALNRWLIPGLQLQDTRFLMEAAGLVFMGSVVNALKDIVANREVEADPSKMLIRAIETSGIVPIYGDLGFGAANVLGFRTSKYKNPDVKGIAPTLGLLGDIGQFSQRLADGEFDENDMKTLKRLTPMGNLFYLNFLLNRVIE